MAANALYQACREYLDACQAALETTDAGGIDRRFVSPGAPAWDCFPQLVVHAGAAIEADTALLVPALAPMHRIEQGRVVPLAQITATVLRCAPTLKKGGQFPDPDVIDAAAQTSLEDLWAIWNYLSSRKRDGTLFAPDSREFIFDPAQSVSIMGGACGWVIPIRVYVPGYKS